MLWLYLSTYIGEVSLERIIIHLLLLSFHEILAPTECHSICLTSLMSNSAKEAVGEDETPCGAWLVTRLRSAARGTLNSPGVSLSIGPKGGLGEHGDAVSRQLILTKGSLVERRPENYEVS